MQGAMTETSIVVSLIERFGLGMGIALVCMYFYRKDVLQRDQERVELLKECFTVIKENTKIIAEHTAMIKPYMEGEEV